MNRRLILACHLALLGLVQLLPLHAADEPFNPPEFYERVRAKRKRIIEEQTRTFDLTRHPRYRIAINDRENTIHVKKKTYSFEINKKNGVVDRVELLDVTADKQCAFGDLEVTDAQGVVYRQSACRDGTFTTSQENIYLYWTVKFSPVAADGHALPVTIEARYQLFKLSGLVKVQYKVLSGSAEIKQLVVRNSPGILPVPLDTAFTAFFFDNSGSINDTLTLPVNDTETRVIAAGKIPAPFWVNGRIGFHAVALRQTWYQMEPIDADSELKRTVIHTVDGKRHLDFYFVNTDSSTPLKAGREMECGFAFLPFQRYQPTLPLTTTTDAPLGSEYLKSGDDTAIIRDLRRAFWTGGLRGNGVGSVSWPPLMVAITKEPYHTRTQHALGIWREIGLLPSGGDIVNAWTGVPGDDLGGVEEVGMATPEFIAAYKREGMTSLSTPEFREWMYDIRASQLEVHNYKIYYEDLHAHIDVGKNFDSQVEGEVRYLEDITLLHAGYGPDKLNIAHAGNILTVADSVNSATWPGEPWTGQFFRKLPLATLDILLNPFLVGTDVCFYGENDIYDMRSLEMCKQMLRNAVVPYYGAVLKTYGGSLVKPFEVRSELAKQNWDNYFVPGRTFRTHESSYVSWRDPEVASYFSTTDTEHKVNLYHRDGEAYATCVKLGEETFHPKLKINVERLGFKGPQAFVFDIVPRRLTVVPINDGWIEYSPTSATQEPVLLYIKDKLDDGPTIVWNRFTVQFERVVDKEIPATEARWVCKVPCLPLEPVEELARVYLGDLGRPRSYTPWGLSRVEEFFPEQKSMDMVYRIPAATDGGPIGAEREIRLAWDKAFQLSFPYLGDE
jgi:hypothetical protein